MATATSLAEAEKITASFGPVSEQPGDKAALNKAIADALDRAFAEGLEAERLDQQLKKILRG